MQIKNRTSRVLTGSTAMVVVMLCMSPGVVGSESAIVRQVAMSITKHGHGQLMMALRQQDQDQSVRPACESAYVFQSIETGRCLIRLTDLVQPVVGYAFCFDSGYAPYVFSLPPPMC